LSTDEQKRYVNAMMNKSVPHVAATPEKHERSEKTKKLVAEIRALSEEVARKEALVRKLEARQGQAIQALKAIVEAGNSAAEPQNKGEAAKGNNGSCGQIEMLPVSDSKRNGVLKLFAPMSGEECFNRAATLYNGKDYPKALRWFCKSADRGCTEGQYRAGWMLAWGDEGVSQNGRKAESYLTCAAEKGHVDAMIQLAFLYEDGRGIEKSPVQALHWFSLAAARHSWAGEQGVQRLKAVQ